MAGKDVRAEAAADEIVAFAAAYVETAVGLGHAVEIEDFIGLQRGTVDEQKLTGGHILLIHDEPVGEVPCWPSRAELHGLDAGNGVGRERQIEIAAHDQSIEPGAAIDPIADKLGGRTIDEGV